LAADVLDGPSRGPERFAVTGDGIAADSVKGRLAEFRARGAFVRSIETEPAIDVVAAPDGILYGLDARDEESSKRPVSANGRELRAASIET